MANRRDVEATAAKHYLDPRSFVSIAGHEYLKGKDIGARRHEIYLRDNGVCQRCGIWVREEHEYLDQRGHMMHKQGGRGPQRCDCPHNLDLGCFECHMGRHGEHKGPQFSKQWYASGREETKR